MRPFFAPAVFSASLVTGLLADALPAQSAGQPRDPSAAHTGSDSWSYVVDAREGHTPRPLFRTVLLSSVKPTGIKETVAYRGHSQRFGELRYGNENSDAVLLVLDKVSETDCDLYVDANRNRTIEVKDRVERLAANEPIKRSGSAPPAVCEWRLPLSAQIRQLDAATLHARTVLIRRRPSSEAVSIATIGFMAGTVELDGRRVQVRRVDGNANGLFSDPEDRLWIDLNGDGIWDNLTEQFPMMPIIEIAGRSYAVKSDRLGERLRLEPSNGDGRVRLQPAGLAAGIKVLQITGMIVGEDGIGFTLSGSDRIAVPTGRYSIDFLSLTLEDANGRTWNYMFSRDPGQAARRTLVVEKNRELAIDPVGRLQLGFDNEYKAIEARPGQTLYYRPLLETAHGLTTNFCRFSGENYERGAECRTTAHYRLQTLAGQVLDKAHSNYECGALCDFAVTVPSGTPAKELKLAGDVDLGPLAGNVSGSILIPIKAIRP